MKKQLRIALFGISLGVLSLAVAACGGDDCTPAADALAMCDSVGASNQEAGFRLAAQLGVCQDEIAAQAACIVAGPESQVCPAYEANNANNQVRMCLNAISSTTT